MKKGNKQLRYIEEYAKANNLIPMKIIQKGSVGASGKRTLLGNAMKLLKKRTAWESGKWFYGTNWKSLICP